jgi:ATP-dependent Clp protease ATP-binding subunit ClpA
MIENLNKRMGEKNLSIEVTTKAKDKLAKDGFSEIYGARPLKRLIEDQIENTISMKIISGELGLGKTVIVDLVRGEYTFSES